MHRSLAVSDDAEVWVWHECSQGSIEVWGRYKYSRCGIEAQMAALESF